MTGSPGGIRAAKAALDDARPAVARLDASRSAEDNAADLIDAWEASQRALQAFGGTSAQQGNALIRDLRQRNMLTLDQAHALVEFSAASERARDTAYTPSVNDIAAALTGMQQLDVALTTAETSEPSAHSGPVSPPHTPPPTSVPPPSHLPGIEVKPPRNVAAMVFILVAVVAVLGASGFYFWRYWSGPRAYAQARQAYAAGDRATARQRFAALARSHSDDAEPHVYLGRIAREDGDLASAAQELETAVRLDPQSSLAQREMGAYLLAIGNLDLARRFYVRALQIDPQDSNAMGFLGCTLMRLGRLEEGQRFLLRAGQGSWSACADMRPGMAPPGAMAPVMPPVPGAPR
jgi:tetratricopeptide (TPR) repeat protein